MLSTSQKWIYYFVQDHGSIVAGTAVRELCERMQAANDRLAAIEAAAKAAKDSWESWGLSSGLCDEKADLEWKDFVARFDRLVKLAMGEKP